MVRQHGNFVGILVIYGAFLSIVIYISGLVNLDFQLRERLLDGAQVEIQNKVESFNRKMEIWPNTIEAIENDHTFKHYLKQRTRPNREVVENLFLTISKSIPSLFQLRYIDETGWENIRVGRHALGQEPYIAFSEALQNKANRYYYKEISALPKGEVWVSNIDLNVEHNRIQRPLIPTVRIGVPVYHEKQFRGVIIINILMKPYLDELIYSSNYLLMLSDRDGEILMHPNASERWSRYLNRPSSLCEILGSDCMNLKGNAPYLGDRFWSQPLHFKNGEALWLSAVVRSEIEDATYYENAMSLGWITFVVLVLGIPLGLWIGRRFEKINRHFDAVIKGMGDAVLLISPTGKIVLFNPAVERMFGDKITHGESIEKSFPELKEVLSKAEHASYESEFTRQLEGGDRIDVEVVLTPLLEQQAVSGTIAVIHDVSEKRTMLRRLKEQSEAMEAERNLFIEGPIVIFKWQNRQKWPVEYVSNNVENLLGYEASELRSGEIAYSELIHPDDLERVGREVEDAKRDKLQGFIHEPYRICTRSGRVRWVYDETVLLYDELGEVIYFFGYIVDITDQISSTETFKTLFETSATPIGITDLESHFLEVNPAFERMSGWSKEELLQNSCFNLSLEEDKPNVQKALQSVMELRAVTVRKSCIKKDGGAIPVRLSLTLMPDNERLLVIANDISNEAKAEDDLQRRLSKEAEIRLENETKLRTVYDYVGVGICLIDMTGYFIEANLAFVEIFGYELDLLREMTIMDLSESSEMFETSKEVMNLIRGDKEVYSRRKQFVHRNGGQLWCNTTVTLVRDENGVPQYLVGMVDNITSRVELEEERKTQEALIVQQAKMATMGEMIGAIAHQWKQPLNAMGLMVQDLQDAWEFDEIDDLYLEDFTKQSLESIQFMSRTVEDFRRFFKEERERQVFELVDSIRSVGELLRTILRHDNITLELTNGANQIMVDGFENEFKQVILNMIVNAKDAILSKQKKESFKGRIVMHVAQNETHAVIDISDNGGGIPEDVIGRIFDAQFTTKGESGTGIGLSLAKTIIEEKMNGSLQVENCDGGACFTLTLLKAPQEG